MPGLLFSGVKFQTMPPHQQADTVLRGLVQRLRKALPDLVAIWHFGSFGTPAQRPGSDIDLGLYGREPFDPVLLFDLAGELATWAHRDVDLVDLICCSTVMRAQIVATGRIVHCADRYLCDVFAMRAYSQYAYLNEARRGIVGDMHVRGAAHGR